MKFFLILMVMNVRGNTMVLVNDTNPSRSIYNHEACVKAGEFFTKDKPWREYACVPTASTVDEQP